MSFKGKAAEITPDEVVSYLITKYLRVEQCSVEALATAICVSRTTMYNRLRSPSTFTFAEMQRLVRFLQFSEEDVKLMCAPMFACGAAQAAS